MAGFDNEVMFALGERLQASTAQAITLMQQTATDVSRVNFSGNPNGTVAANPSSLSHDPTSGNLWLKATGTGNTGWVLLTAGGVTLTADDTNSLTGTAFNLFGQKASTTPVMDTLVAGGNFLFENRNWETQYVVSGSTTAGVRGTFSTIQSAINQAVTDGAAVSNYKRIYIRFGIYAENLTIPPGIILTGEVLPAPTGGATTPFQSTSINGNHVYTGANTCSFEDLNFVTTTGAIFSPSGSPTAFQCYTRNCFFAALDGTSNTFDTTGVATSYISCYECSFAGGTAQVMIKMPAGGSLKLVDCAFSQAGAITTSSTTITMINCVGMGNLICTNASVNIVGCIFTSASGNYNISGTAAGNIIGCLFSGAGTAAIQNTVTAVLQSCGTTPGVGLNTPVLFETGTVYKQPLSNQGNLVQGTINNASIVTPYTITNSSYFNGINATVNGAQVLVNTGGGGFCEGQIIIIKDTTGNAATNNIIITSTTGILIDGATSITINKNYGSFVLRFNGTNFNVVNQNTGLSSLGWSVVTTNGTFTVNSGTIANKAGTLTMALPAASAVGDIIKITGINTATGWQITQAAGQQIFFGTSSTTLGATGTLTSSNIRDSLEMVCVVANTTWNVLNSVGNITVA